MLIHGIWLEHDVVPVEVRIGILVEVVNRVLNFLRAVIWLKQGVVVELGFIVQVHVGHSVNRLQHFCGGRKPGVRTEGDLGLSCNSFLGSNHDNSICPFGSIQSGRGGILQYGELLNVVGIYTGQVG